MNKDKERSVLTVSFQVTPSQALALNYYRNKSFCLSEKEFRNLIDDKTVKLVNGYYKGYQEIGICNFPSMKVISNDVHQIGKAFVAPYEFRDDEGNEIDILPIWARVVVDGDNAWITVHLQKVDKDAGGFRPYDWEMKEYIPEDKFSS